MCFFSQNADGLLCGGAGWLVCELFYRQHYHVIGLCQNHSDHLMNVFLKSVLHREAEIKHWNIKLLPFSPTAWQPATWSSSNSWGSQRREDLMRIIGYNILFSYGAYAISSVIQKPSCTLAEMFTYYASIRAVQRNCKRTCKITTYFPPHTLGFGGQMMNQTPMNDSTCDLFWLAAYIRLLGEESKMWNLLYFKDYGRLLT